MSEAVESTCKIVNKWINRLRVKSRHTAYMNDELSYSEYKWYVYITVNSIRKVLGYEPFSKSKFDEAWQYRCVAHENWEVARNEIVNIILGWW
jgi:hypothetical protein